jgi:hypothetical protein
MTDLRRAAQALLALVRWDPYESPYFDRPAEARAAVRALEAAVEGKA